MTQDPLARFVEYFQALAEPEQLALGQRFHEITGGKLSPYNSPNPVVIALVPVETPRGTCLLGVRRAIDPGRGQIALPGGYVEPGEEVEVAAAREVWEETGAQVDPAGFRACGLPRQGKHNTLLCFLVSDTRLSYSEFEHLCDNLHPGGESSEVVLVDPSTLLAFPLHQKVVSEFFD